MIDIQLYERTTNINLNLVELMMLNGLMQQCIDLPNSDKTNKELKLKLSKAIYNVARQEYRSDKRHVDSDNKKTIDDIMAGWVHQSTKKHYDSIKNDLAVGIYKPKRGDQ